jgi:hypothetical protein
MTIRQANLPAALALGALLQLCACATGGARAGMAAVGGSGQARDGFEAWLGRGDVVAAERDLRAAVEEDPGDPWGRMGLALLARRSLDTGAELTELLAVVRAVPDGAPALVALERMAELARVGPDAARAIEAGLAPLAGEGRLRGVAAFRARVARISAAESLGDPEAVARLRREYGVVTEWTLVGPFSPLVALDFDAPLPTDGGRLPAEAPTIAGAPPAAARSIPTPDGVLALPGEAVDEGLHLLASDVRLSRGGRYLLVLWTLGSAKVQLDGAPAAERRGHLRDEPLTQLRELELSPGLHRLVARFAPGSQGGAIAVGLSRADGAPSDAAWSAPAPGPVPEAVSAELPHQPWTAPRLAEALARGGGPVLGRLLAARAFLRMDREGAKALLVDAAAMAPDAAPVRTALADALGDDPTLDAQAARSRGEAELRRALARDAGDAEARLALSFMLRQSDRAADAETLLAGLPAAVADRPAARVERAAVAKARGAPERADALAAQAAAEGSCEARALSYESAMARDAVAAGDALARELLACPGGRDRLIQHLERRGALAEALEAAAPTARARPSALDAALTRAELLVASGDAAGARRELEAVAAFWPESARLWKRLGNVRELAGDRAGARAARERALAADGSELVLRRALALEDGREVLDELREDGGAAIKAYEQAGTAGDTSTALVLDASAQEFYPGGAVTDRTHQVIHVLDQRGVDKYGEVRLPPGAELVTLRTLKRDGKVLEPDGGRAKGAISLAGLEPGDYVEVEYLRASRGAIDGYAADPFFFQDEGERLVRSTYVVTAPAALGLEVDARRMDPPPLVRDGDRVTVRALRTEVPGLVGEPDAPPLAEILPSMQVGYGAGREALHRRMANTVAGRARQTVELAAFARDVRQAAGKNASPEALARAAWSRVAARVLGGGGSLGDDASEILSRGRGSRTLLLKAALDALGVEARIALVRPFEADAGPQRFPRHGLYRQTLLRIRAGGRDLWIDPDERAAPFGSLPPSALDAEALVLSAPGEALEVARTPAKAVIPSARTTSVRLRVDAGGSATVEVTDRYSGHSAGVIRGALERFDAITRRRIFEQTVSASFRGGTLDGLEFKGEEDREGDLTLGYRASVPDFARRANGALVVESPILPARLGETFVRLAERKLPLLISPQDPLVQRIELTVPDGFVVVAAPDVALTSRWGRYERAERVEGNTLVREEHVALFPARVAPSDYTDFARFVTEIDGIQAAPVRIGHGANPGGRP